VKELSLEPEIYLQAHGADFDLQGIFLIHSITGLLNKKFL
jgi:hypothetical protein